MSELFIQKVRDAGIVGAGGAGFPSHVKYGAKVEYVIANGAECEPLLYCDQTIMARFAPQIISGLKALMEHTSATHGVVALKRKYSAAVAALREAISSEPSISLHLMDSFYPAGDEQVIVHEVTGRTVPEAGIPLDVNVIVANVASLMNVAAALEGDSVTSRYLTVNGAVAEPFTAKVPLGVSFRELVELAGGATVSDFTVVSGGPMMGKLSSLESFVTKTTSGILIFPSDHPHIKRLTQKGDSVLKRTKSVCDQCMACTEICPRFLLGHNLQPHRIMRSLAYGLADNEVVSSAMLCCECGVCSFYACPLYLSPGVVNGYIKRQLGAKGFRYPKTGIQSNARSYRHERLLPTSRLASRIGIAAYTKQEAPFKEIPEFNMVKIPLKQHIGAPSEPVVTFMQSVNKGDLIAKIPEGKLGANIHASISGQVTDITDAYIEIRK